MMTTPDLQAAQPTFSDRELELLLRTLNIDADVHNEHDRQRALEVLGSVLLDSERSEQVLEALSELEESVLDVASKQSILSSDRPKPITRRAPKPAAAAPMPRDEPTTGRLLNALHARTHAHLPDVFVSHNRGERESAGGLRGHLFVDGCTRYTTVENVIISAIEQDHTYHEHFRHFLDKAREALSERTPSLLERLGDALDAFRGASASRTGPAARFVSSVNSHTVDVQLWHGPREWHVEVRLLEPVVIVCVTNKNTTVIEQDVANTKPEEFSRTLLNAFDGDIRSTKWL